MKFRKVRFKEFNICCEDAKEETIREITEWIGRNPYIETLIGSLKAYESGKDEEYIEITFNESHPDPQRIRESLSRLPHYASLSGFILTNELLCTD